MALRICMFCHESGISLPCLDGWFVLVQPGEPLPDYWLTRLLLLDALRWVASSSRALPVSVDSPHLSAHGSAVFSAIGPHFR